MIGSKKVVAIVDGGMIGSNPGKGGWGGCFRLYIGDTLVDERFYGESFGDEEVTNNICEWRAINGAMMRFIEKYWDAQEFRIISDSKLVVMQSRGKWQCKDDHLAQLKKIFNCLHSRLDGHLTIEHKRREHTTVAHDHIAKILGRV